MKSPFYKTSDKSGHYETLRPVSIDEIVDMARRLISRRFAKGRGLTSPADSQDYLLLKLSHLEHEIFCAIFLDNRHRILAYDELFRGTIDGAAVHPREIVKRAIELNAAAVIFAHNHPSGFPEPSQSDIRLTARLIDAMKLVDIRVLDHFIVGGSETVSFAERGLI
jgi:DNA repair protein RadC